MPLHFGGQAVHPPAGHPAAELYGEELVHCPRVLETRSPRLQRAESRFFQESAQLVRTVHPALLHDARITGIRRSTSGVQFFRPDRHSRHAGILTPRRHADDPAGPQYALDLAERSNRVWHMEQNEGQYSHIEDTRPNAEVLRVHRGQVLDAASMGDAKHPLRAIHCNDVRCRRVAAQITNELTRAGTEVENRPHPREGERFEER
jgi:hypothetical protein